MSPPCGTPGCSRPQTKGRRFCKRCAANLDRIRKELEEDPALLFNKKMDAQKVKRVPTCCFVGCFEERVPGERYCYAHRDEGGDD